MIRTILFDLDNTLCDYDASVNSAFAAAVSVAEETYQTVDFERVRLEFDAILDEWSNGNKLALPVAAERTERFYMSMSRCGVEDRRLAERMAEVYGQVRSSQLAAFPEANGVLERLMDSYALVLVTNGPSEVQHAEIKHLDIARHFNHIIVSGDLEFEKPDSRIFALALELAGCAPDQAVFVGDSPGNDIAGAHVCGITSIWVNRTGAPYPPALPRPDHEIRTLSDLGAVLLSIR